MPGKDTRFGEYLASEIRKYGGVYVPVKASALLCQLKRKARISQVHPNPNDEFCQPKVGPNYQIIGEYEHQFREALRHSHIYCEEPVIVEKIRPDGYMLLNGHHRWGAAWRLGYKSIPVRIVNLTQETDIVKALKNSERDRRVTFDLDEVVFQKDAGAPSERALPFPFNRLYPERLRLGIPALFHFFAKNGYDIWVYSASYYSIGYIRALLKRYRVSVSGIVTGTGRKTRDAEAEKKRIAQLFNSKYKATIHISDDALLRTFSGSAAFEEYPLDASLAEWSLEIMDIVRNMDSGSQPR
ncbi:MAG: ParB N-terminal domain-containing protein [Clostridia bacterium]|nr:ParB N-terminal domain-containing protein [Clostridia bacterium]